jgi:hypothetical protein
MFDRTKHMCIRCKLALSEHEQKTTTTQVAATMVQADGSEIPTSIQNNVHRFYCEDGREFMDK